MEFLGCKVSGIKGKKTVMILNKIIAQIPADGHGKNEF
jgi:hypothetical protein